MGKGGRGKWVVVGEHGGMDLSGLSVEWRARKRTGEEEEQRK